MKLKILILAVLLFPVVGWGQDFIDYGARSRIHELRNEVGELTTTVTRLERRLRELEERRR